MRKIIEQCPTCQCRLTITEVVCDSCGTAVRSRYRPCPFCALDDEQQTFLMLFLRTRGNLKELEKTLGISYPTVRAKLDELLATLDQPRPEPPGERREILARLQAGELTAEAALALLKER